MARAEVTIAGDRRCFGSREGKMFLSLSTSLLPHFLHYSLSISISQSSSISISHLSQVFLLPSMVIQSPWKPWATEQQEATVGFLCLVLYLSFCLPLHFQHRVALVLTFCPLSIMQRSPFHLIASHLSSHVVLRIHPFISHSFICVILSLFLS